MFCMERYSFCFDCLAENNLSNQYGYRRDHNKLGTLKVKIMDACTGRNYIQYGVIKRGVKVYKYAKHKV